MEFFRHDDTKARSFTFKAFFGSAIYGKFKKSDYKSSYSQLPDCKPGRAVNGFECRAKLLNR
ncbi:MAG: hypothetical protein ACXWEY_17030, partial [Bacteroidia bacterium]